MITLIGFAFVLVTAVLWFLVRPLLARTTLDDTAEECAQLGAVRDRLLTALNELDVDSHDGAMDATLATDERARLETELAGILRRLETTAPAGAAPSPAAPWWPAALTIAAGIVVLATTVYAVNVTAIPGGLEYTAPAELASGGDPAPMSPQIMQMVERLETRLKSQPNDGQGWSRLGRSYAVLGRAEAAKQAYARAYKLRPDDPEVLAGYAGVLYSEAPRVTSGLVHKLYTRLYHLEPDHPEALWFMGLAAYNSGKTKQALGFWQRLLALLPPDSQDAEHLKNVIGSAHERLGVAAGGGSRNN